MGLIATKPPKKVLGSELTINCKEAIKFYGQNHPYIPSQMLQDFFNLVVALEIDAQYLLIPAGEFYLFIAVVDNLL